MRAAKAALGPTLPTSCCAIRSYAGAAGGKCYLCSVSTHHQVIWRDADGSPHSEPPTARHDDAVRCLLAIELSRKSWIVAVNTPLSDKISRYTLKPCDGKPLLVLCERNRTRVARETKKPVEIVFLLRCQN
jgi:hypothetical protein